MPPIIRQKNALFLMLRISPNAKRQGWEGLWNGTHLKLVVSAPAVDGKANAAVSDFLSDYFHVRSAAIHLLAGDTNRMKRFQIIFNDEITAQKYEQTLGQIR